MRRELTNSFDKLYLTIEYDDANLWVYTNWIGVLTNEQVILGCSAIIDVLQANPCSWMLNDNRALIGSWSSSNEWIAQQWVPQAAALGLKRFAHIVAPGLFGQASAAEFIARVDKQFETRLFQDVELAKKWLRGE